MPVNKFMVWNKEVKSEVRRMKLHARDKSEKEEKEKEEREAIRSKAKDMTYREEELCRNQILNEIENMYEAKIPFLKIFLAILLFLGPLRINMSKFL